MTKDRAVPFSRKHRRYWIPVTGGMILLGAINLALGLSSYRSAPVPMHLDIGLPPQRAPGMLAPGDLPVPVVRAFVTRYPHTIALGAIRDSERRFVITFPPGATHHHATFTADGTFVSED